MCLSEPNAAALDRARAAAADARGCATLEQIIRHAALDVAAVDRYIETVRDAALRHFVAGLLLSGRVTETEVRAATSERIADLLHQEYQRLCTTPRKAVRHGVAAR